MTLSKDQVSDVCLLGQGTQQCRYLAEDDVVRNMFYCLKKSKDKKEKIDVEVSSLVKDLKRKGKDIDAQNIPVGNNCSGYIILKHIEQGYDVK
jgi:hypothetical protein